MVSFCLRIGVDLSAGRGRYSCCDCAASAERQADICYVHSCSLCASTILGSISRLHYGIYVKFILLCFRTRVIVALNMPALDASGALKCLAIAKHFSVRIT